MNNNIIEDLTKEEQLKYENEVSFNKNDGNIKKEKNGIVLSIISLIFFLVFLKIFIDCSSILNPIFIALLIIFTLPLVMCSLILGFIAVVKYDKYDTPKKFIRKMLNITNIITIILEVFYLVFLVIGILFSILI